MNAFRKGVSLLALGMLAFGATAALAQEELPAVTIEYTAEGFTIPGEIVEGPVAVTFVNNTDAPMAPGFTRLNEDVTLEAFSEAAAEDPFAALQMVAMYGGIQLDPNSSFDMTVDFVPGTHVLINFFAEEPEIASFEVADAEGEGAAAPEADVEVNLLDFAFSFPLQLEAGEQVWSVSNEGGQWHEFGFLQVPDDMTVAEFRTLINGMATGEAEPEGQPFFFAPMTPGEQAWITVDLEPGTYIIGCFLPDFASGHAHADLGMVQIFNVSGE